MTAELPDLIAVGFIAGRVADADDVRSGRAVFHTNGTGGGAAVLDIPQYALLLEEPGNQVPVILVQAEHAPKEQTVIVGLRRASGEAIIARFDELQLLGRKRPK